MAPTVAVIHLRELPLHRVQPLRDVELLLGLVVDLDNCEGGPVQVCVSASEGEGLLGELLCGLTGGGLLPDLGNLGQIIDGLGLDLTDRQVDRLVGQARRLLRDGNLSLQDIEKLARFVQRLA